MQHPYMLDRNSFANSCPSVERSMLRSAVLSPLVGLDLNHEVTELKRDRQPKSITLLFAVYGHWTLGAVRPTLAFNPLVQDF